MQAKCVHSLGVSVNGPGVDDDVMADGDVARRAPDILEIDIDGVVLEFAVLNQNIAAAALEIKTGGAGLGVGRFGQGRIARVGVKVDPHDGEVAYRRFHGEETG